MTFYGHDGLRVWTPSLHNSVAVELRSDDIRFGNFELGFAALGWPGESSAGLTSDWMFSESQVRGTVKMARLGLDLAVRRNDAVAQWLKSAAPLAQRVRASASGWARFRLGSPRLNLVAERDTLQELRFFLVRDLKARARLTERSTCRALADALKVGCLPYPQYDYVVGRDRNDIEVAARELGLIHERRRPMPGDLLYEMEEAIAMVRGQLHKNPYRSDTGDADSAIRRWLRQFYYVDPWPFAALCGQ